MFVLTRSSENADIPKIYCPLLPVINALSIGRIRFTHIYFESASDLLLYANNDFIVIYYKFE